MGFLHHRALKSILAGVLVFAALAGCSQDNAGQQAAASKESDKAPMQITLLSPKAPSLIPALLVERQANTDMKLKVETWDTIEQLLARIQNNDAPFVAAPLNVGANIHAKGLPLQLLHLNTWGSMYLVSLDPEARTLANLDKETVHIPGQSGPPDILTRFLLRKNGLEGKVKLAYGTVPDIMQQLAGATIKHAVLPEPVLSGLRMKLGGRLNVVVDYQKTWRDTYGEDLPQAGIFVHSGWAKKHREEIVRFQSLYREAMQKTVKQPEEGMKLAAGAFGMPEAALLQAMPHIGLTFKDAAEAKPEVERYFNLLLQHAPDSIGGALPDAGFYYGL
ncbi:hypothetical protein QJ48_10855 [Paenibacillus sp. A3]|uniref:ABC transporter substrate-binding protein n=1 Tax=Paenibacillus sp. A3 TaxID=1337054 RepID=UPI0006D5325A|nr:MqnA/MqnD/SBP family protein [Paenibacillus sp. A3]KPV59449.1 hypothetical protein QJ48_10855 [Paenibacillus sp. A3]